MQNKITLTKEQFIETICKYIINRCAIEPNIDSYEGSLMNEIIDSIQSTIATVDQTEFIINIEPWDWVNLPPTPKD